jgi:hypothetical protein
LVHGNHDTKWHTSSITLVIGIHHNRNFTYSNKFSNLNSFTSFVYSSLLIIRFLTVRISFISSVFCSFRFTTFFLPCSFLKSLNLIFLFCRLYFGNNSRSIPYKSWSSAISIVTSTPIWSNLIRLEPGGLGVPAGAILFLYFCLPHQLPRAPAYLGDFGSSFSFRFIKLRQVNSLSVNFFFYWRVLILRCNNSLFVGASSL